METLINVVWKLFCFKYSISNKAVLAIVKKYYK